MSILETLGRLGQTSGFYMLFNDWRQILMIAIACVLLYLGLVKKFEPLLLIGIAFGMLLTNLPGSNMYHPELWDKYIEGTVRLTDIVHEGGLPTAGRSSSRRRSSGCECLRRRCENYSSRR